MHDPDVVAFEIRRPWPKRYKAKTIDGRTLPAQRYWPALVTVWHREPRGHDSGTICKHYRRLPSGKAKILHGWRWHIHHWRIQIPPLQELRRRLLTRCAWCGGRHRKGDPVNTSHSWDGPRGRWWQGEPGLYHGDCSAISSAHATCTCDNPEPRYGDHGVCLWCGRFRPYGLTEENLTRARELSAVPAGARKPSGDTE